MSLSKLAEEFYRLRSEKDTVEDHLKIIDTQLKSLEEQMVEAFGEQGLNRIDLADKGSFTLTSRTFYSASDRQALLAFLHEQDATDLLSVNHNTLNGYVKELKERNGEDFEVPGVKSFTKSAIRLTRPRN